MKGVEGLIPWNCLAGLVLPVDVAIDWEQRVLRGLDTNEQVSVSAGMVEEGEKARATAWRGLKKEGSR